MSHALFAAAAALLLTFPPALAQPGAPAQPAQPPARRSAEDLAAYIRDHYTKAELRIPVRDGVHLFTSVYTPKDASPDKTYPIMLNRTPYSVGPYGDDRFKDSLGPSDLFARDGFIFVYQDVRGCYMSEGEFVNVRPHADHKPTGKEVDESTDTFDTIAWLTANLDTDNGRVGMWGISYPGFYAAAGMIDAHPALKAVSPQAPIGDWYFDDFFHHGAFFLPHTFNFFAGFGRPRPEPTTQRPGRFDHGTPDGYQFFLDLGPLSNVNDRYYKNEIAFWNEVIEHPTRDAWWQARCILPRLKNVAPAVMTTGGWFDAEDLYGALNVYQSIEAQNPGIFNMLVMGPWVHGGWARTDGASLGAVDFGGKQSLFYREHVEFPFFRHHLKAGPGEAPPELPEAWIFETGVNQWRSFDAWPPVGAVERSLFARAGEALSWEPPAPGAGFAEFVSDPAKPIPYTEAIAIGMTREYMVDDQRFAARRPDVLTFQTPPLTADVTLAGPIIAELWASTSGTDSDWIVKLIDVFPPDAADTPTTPPGRRMGGYQMMVRGEVLRGRYRDSYEHPEPFVPNQPTRVEFEIPDVLHTFKKGHRIMVQVQCTWFPLVDRNPQKYVDNIFKAREEDFIKATQRIYFEDGRATRLRVRTLEAPKMKGP